MINILKRIRYMNDTEFNMLCDLLGLNQDNQVNQVNPVMNNQMNQSVNPVSGVNPVNPVPVNPVNPVSGVNPVNPVNPVPVNPVNPVPVNQAGKWHNISVVSDPQYETEKSYAYMFVMNNAQYVFFIPRSLCRVYNNILSFGIQDNKYYTYYSVTNYQTKEKSKMPEIKGSDLARILSV